MSASDRDTDVDNAFKQLDGALCIWSRAKGEQPLKQYFHEVTPNVRRMLLDDKIYQVIITVANDEKDKDDK